MGSIGITDTVVSLPDTPKAWSCSNLPATTTRKPLTQQNIADLREILKETDDGSILLVPGDDGYDNTIRRWSRAVEKRAVRWSSAYGPVNIKDDNPTMDPHSLSCFYSVNAANSHDLFIILDLGQAWESPPPQFSEVQEVNQCGAV
jgi:hypothetical protein